jgi:uncharacterized protein (DUF2236 family)
MSIVAQLFGTPANVIPPILGKFREYLDGQIASDTITVTEPARKIAKVILEAPLPRPIQLLAPAHHLATSAQLPRRLRHEYGLRCSSLHRLTLPLAARSLKLTAFPILLAASKLAPPSGAA